MSKNSRFIREHVKIDTKKDIVFQALSWETSNEIDQDEEVEEGSKPKQNLKIRIYGVTENLSLIHI